MLAQWGEEGGEEEGAEAGRHFSSCSGNDSSSRNDSSSSSRNDSSSSSSGGGGGYESGGSGNESKGGGGGGGAHERGGGEPSPPSLRPSHRPTAGLICRVLFACARLGIELPGQFERLAFSALPGCLPSLHHVRRLIEGRGEGKEGGGREGMLME